MLIIDNKINVSQSILNAINPVDTILKAIEEGFYSESEVLDSLEENFLKGVISDELFDNAVNELGWLLEKAGRDITKLYKKIMVDKKGIRRTVYVLAEKSDDHIHKQLKHLHKQGNHEGIKYLLSTHKMSQGVVERLKAEGLHDIHHLAKQHGLVHENNEKHEQRQAQKAIEQDKRIEERAKKQETKESIKQEIKLNNEPIEINDAGTKFYDIENLKPENVEVEFKDVETKDRLLTGKDVTFKKIEITSKEMLKSVIKDRQGKFLQEVEYPVTVEIGQAFDGSWFTSFNNDFVRIDSKEKAIDTAKSMIAVYLKNKKEGVPSRFIQTEESRKNERIKREQEWDQRKKSKEVAQKINEVSDKITDNAAFESLKKQGLKEKNISRGMVEKEKRKLETEKANELTPEEEAFKQNNLAEFKEKLKSDDHFLSTPKDIVKEMMKEHGNKQKQKEESNKSRAKTEIEKVYKGIESKLKSFGLTDTDVIQAEKEEAEESEETYKPDKESNLLGLSKLLLAYIGNEENIWKEKMSNLKKIPGVTETLANKILDGYKKQSQKPKGTKNEYHYYDFETKQHEKIQNPKEFTLTVLGKQQPFVGFKNKDNRWDIIEPKTGVTIIGGRSHTQEKTLEGAKKRAMDNMQRNESYFHSAIQQKLKEGIKSPSYK